MCSSAVFGWTGFYPSGILGFSSIDVSTGKVSSPLTQVDLYPGECACSSYGVSTFPCAGSEFEYSTMNYTQITASGALTATRLLPKEFWNIQYGWFEGVGVSAYMTRTFVAGLDYQSKLVALYEDKDSDWAILGMWDFKGLGVVDSFVATPNYIFFGLGNITQSHWDRKAPYTVARFSLADPKSAPLNIAVPGGISWTSCNWSAKFNGVLCLAKADQVKGPTTIFLIDETGALKNMCTSVKGLPDNIYPTTSAVDEGSIYLNGYPENSGSPPVESLYTVDVSACSASSVAWQIDSNIGVIQFAVLK